MHRWMLTFCPKLHYAKVQEPEKNLVILCKSPVFVKFRVQNVFANVKFKNI